MELKPCPFCGCEAVLVNEFFDDYLVMCSNSGCAVEGPLKATSDEAETAWNTRPAAAVDELIEAVRKANGLLDELIRLGKEGMEPDYTRWITFHDKVAELASEARAALTGRGE